MPFEEPADPSGDSKTGEVKEEIEERLDDETMRQVVYDIFFGARHPSSLSELGERITEQAKTKGISRDVLEKNFMEYLGDEMANSVD